MGEQPEPVERPGRARIVEASTDDLSDYHEAWKAWVAATRRLENVSDRVFPLGSVLEIPGLEWRPDPTPGRYEITETATVSGRVPLNGLPLVVDYGTNDAGRRSGVRVLDGIKAELLVSAELERRASQTARKVAP